LVHISNRHMELEQVVGAVAAAEGLVAMAKFDDKANQVLVDYKAKAHVAVLARTPSDLRTLAQKSGWKRIDPGKVIAWTDDYSDILSAILRKKLGR